MNIDWQILLWINGHHSEWADVLMWYVSSPLTWLPMYALLIGILVYKYRNWKAVLFIIIGFVVAVGLSDFTCSGILKPLICRPRPTHEPALAGLVHIVNGYTGGLYGFCSSHAANTMACGLLFSLLYRNKIATSFLMAWVALNCYSRMYLGAHYPGDIIVGLLVGALYAVLVWLALTRWLHVDDAAARRGDS
ncbi:MAG: phosphatase PAP2 family protein [Paludibacteraceae bacterium]|nr:phosphatase PAP2 family protein [Paludibacteraceae bacterium]